MAHAYTPGLKVTARMLFRKDRRLPLRGDVLHKVGDRVKARDIVARTHLPGRVYPVNVANLLGVGPEALAEHMRVKEGESIREGEILAQTPGFFGLFKAEVKSPVNGTVESISRVTGLVIIQADPIPVQVDAYMDGEVVEVHPEEGVVVESEVAFVQGIFGLGGEVHAQLQVIATSPEETIDQDKILPEHKGKILVGGGFLTLEAVQKAISLKVAGIVTGGFDYQDIKQLLGYEVGVAITGTEKLGLTLMLTEGFGQISMARTTFDLLMSHNGHFASMNGATQIRAGVIRPEVVVTHADRQRPRTEGPPEVKGTEAGDLVRVIRAPWFGRIGKVVGLPVDLRTMESETRVRVMTIEFDDGNHVELPRSNVEMIER